jgi:hypothetical protein
VVSEIDHESARLAEFQGAVVKVLVLPNQRRPGIGRQPVRENRRAWLPQQARFCPVLEDGSRLGYLVYPPLEDEEVLQARRLREETLRFSFAVTAVDGTAHTRWVIDVTASAGGGGLDAHELQFAEEGLDLDTAQVLAQLDALTVNLNGPPGAVGIRGAFDFVTPEGWDTVYLGVLNELQPPHVPVLAARIETDWYPQPTEFRYALGTGQTVSVAGSAPIGQVFFVPRESADLKEGSAQDAAQFEEREREYWTERAAKERPTNFGTIHSYHYRDVQRDRGTGLTTE